MEREATEPLYLDLHLDAGSEETLEIPAGHNAFLYVYQGEIAVGATARRQGRQMAVLDNRADSDGVSLRASADSRLLLIAGKPWANPSRNGDRL